jgi:hypothetical protein
MSPDGVRNQERLCWRGPTVIYCYAMLRFFPEMLLPSGTLLPGRMACGHYMIAKCLKEF